LLAIAETDVPRVPGLFIDGHWRTASGGTAIDIVEPFTGGLITSIPAAEAADVDAAVASAKAAFESGPWARMTSVERSDVLNRFADICERNRGAIAALESRDVGMPAKVADITISIGIGMIRHCAALARTLSNRTFDGMGSAFHTYVRREPVGVVGIITPWNGPFVLLCAKLAAALAAGCTCVIKPAELAPLSSTFLMALLIEAGVPAGVVNLIVGTGPVAGEALAKHPDVSKISFTGSTKVGQHLIRLSADNLTRLTLELGGKSPLIVMDDANLDAAVPAAAWGVFGNSGQACYACSRVYVQEDVYPRFVERLKDFAASMTYGAPQSPDTDLGPLISRDHRDRVAERVERERTEGGSLLLGGTFGEGGGFGYRPTIIGDCAPQSAAMREEIFGPVVCVTPFRSVDEVVVAANDTAYGLAAGLFTNDLNRAHTIAQQLRAGTVWINCYAHVDPTQPFGGYKQSGWGREFGPDALEPFLEVKSVQIALG
jgi:phenylacetaldehyde dehydrogenase